MATMTTANNVVTEAENEIPAGQTTGSAPAGDDAGKK